ncbi:hypothetical protein PUN28_011992 [Cardiocondyla obscurior]|uniref:Uncharacterized protein n=1 Tax=Cardiocondyla obscurior TaxID=286306 RepID=A0AAW2F8W2_9HYME
MSSDSRWAQARILVHSVHAGSAILTKIPRATPETKRLGWIVGDEPRQLTTRVFTRSFVPHSYSGLFYVISLLHFTILFRPSRNDDEKKKNKKELAPSLHSFPIPHPPSFPSPFLRSNRRSFFFRLINLRARG